ncbi:MAG: polysaccharide deacetylase family protein [Cyclobacteriaceae bacterium]|nr:polysaccharide deacetylase family protein [Cyclobacteriaceae bacterium]
MVKSYLFALCFVLGVVSYTACAQKGEIYLLVRADDIGFSRSANLACIDSYTKGIARSVEVMVPGPWFEEAVALLREHPDYDVGVHLVLTSEWTGLKWRPLTHAPSLTDEDGYFHPFIWPNKVEGATFFRESAWKLEEVEAEMRAQIELALKKIPQISHMSYHMGMNQADPDINDMLKKLAAEYKIDIDPARYNVQRARGWEGSQTSPYDKEERFIKMLEELKPGIHMLVEHPGYDDAEMRGVGHVGYENVAEDRKGVTHVMTSEKVKEVIKKRGIKLISYKDLPSIKN